MMRSLNNVERCTAHNENQRQDSVVRVNADVWNVDSNLIIEHDEW